MIQLLRDNFRLWWQKPRTMDEREAHRTVTFLELFYDLVYVVLIAQLAHGLAGDVTWAGLGQFVFMFIIVWWSWFNGMSYHDFHGNNDIRTRVFTFLQMICVAAMAAFAHDPLHETAVPFAIAYGIFQLILTFMWWRVGVHDPDHRRISNPYSLAFLTTALLFLGSAFVGDSIRIYMWGVAILISLLLPLMVFGLTRSASAERDDEDRMLDTSPSMVERAGLLTIIVLGEVVVGVVNGLSEQYHHLHHLTWSMGLSALFGIVIAIGLWWVYFDLVSHRKPIESIPTIAAWMYLHLPLTAAIGAVGAAVLNTIEQTEHGNQALPPHISWLLVGSVAAVLFGVAILSNVIQVDEAHQSAHGVGRRGVLVCAVVVMSLGFVSLPPVWLLAVIAVLLLVPVVLAVSAWVATAAAYQNEHA